MLACSHAETLAKRIVIEKLYELLREIGRVRLRDDRCTGGCRGRSNVYLWREDDWQPCRERFGCCKCEVFSVRGQHPGRRSAQCFEALIAMQHPDEPNAGFDLKRSCKLPQPERKTFIVRAGEDEKDVAMLSDDLWKRTNEALRGLLTSYAPQTKNDWP